MNKLIAIVALCATSFAVPVLPTQAAPVLSDAQTNCLILPMLKKECWQMGAELVAGPAEAVAAVAEDSADAAVTVDLPVLWWNCTAAPSGSGHLFDC